MNGRNDETLGWDELCDPGLSDDEKRAACEKYLEELHPSDVDDFFEAYIDPEGPMRYGGDTWDALHYVMRYNVQSVFEACQQDARENR